MPTNEPSSEQITAAIRRAVREAVLEHARAGRSVPISEGGTTIIWLSPAEIFARYAEPNPNRGSPESISAADESRIPRDGTVK